MKRLAIALGVGSGFLCGALTVVGIVGYQRLGLSGAPWVLIEVRNDSAAVPVAIRVESDEATLDVRLSEAAEAPLLIPVYQRGEGAYRIEYRMADGSVCSSGSGYVEAGYRVVERLTDEGAISAVAAELGQRPDPCVKPAP